MEPRQTDRPLVAALFAAGLLAAAQFAKIALSLPQTADAFSQPVARIAYLVSILGVVGILGGVMAGGVVAAFGARRVLLWSLVLGGVLSLLQALLPPLPVFTLLRVVEGASHPGIVVAAPPLMAGIASERDRPLVMSIWAAFFGVAFALAALAFPPLVRAGGLGTLFAVHGLAMLLMALTLAPRLARQPRAPLRLNPWRVHRRIYGNSRLVAPGAGFVFYTVIFVALVTLLPARLGQPGLAVILPLLGLAGTFAGGPLMSRLSPDRFAALAFGSVTVLSLALFAGLGAALVPLFFVMGMAPAASFAMIPHLNDTVPDRARASGCIAQLGNVGTTLGTPLFALCLALGGLGLLYLTLAAAASCGLAVTILLGRIAHAA